MKDVNLVWNPSEYGNLTTVSIPSSSIWVPDIILYNRYFRWKVNLFVFSCSRNCLFVYVFVFSADGKYEITLMTRAKIDFTGNVVWEPPAIYKSSCTINVEFFPFDQQHCGMKVINLIQYSFIYVHLK